MKTFDIVAAVDMDCGIGKQGKIPWRLPSDMQRFKELTSATESSHKKNVVIMGRKTWESLPEKFRPLPDRVNLVLTRNDKLVLPKDVLQATSLNEALALIEQPQWIDQIDNVFVIGGGEVYQEAIVNPQCRKIYLTQVLQKYGCDTFFANFQDSFTGTFISPTFTENETEFYFAIYQRS